MKFEYELPENVLCKVNDGFSTYHFYKIKGIIIDFFVLFNCNCEFLMAGLFGQAELGSSKEYGRKVGQKGKECVIHIGTKKRSCYALLQYGKRKNAVIRFRGYPNFHVLE